MIAESIAKVLVGHRAGATWMARCPAHEDRKPNLSISSGRDGKVLVRCHAGCGQRDVIAILRQRGFLEPGSHGAASPTSAKIAFPMHTNALTRSEAGYKARGPLRAIRDKCLDFSCSQVSEVRLCEATKCPLWPFRAGKHPWRAEERKTPLGDANSDRQSATPDEGLPSC